MNDLTPEQIEQAAAEVCDELAPILDKFPVAVALAVGIHTVDVALRILVGNGQKESAAYTVDYMLTQLVAWKEHLQDGQEETAAASTEATA
jgi:hypothetical protein